MTLLRFPSCLFLVMLMTQTLLAQPYKVGHKTLTFTDSTRKLRQVTTEIYYPADSAGDDVAVSKHLTHRLPVISFGHGFVMNCKAYKNIWDTLVPGGYIVALPTTEGTFAASHAEFGKDLAFVIHQLQALNYITGSVFYGNVDTMSCVMGHSMGGGSAFLAAAGDPSIKAIATLAAAETKPSAKGAAAKITIPALVIYGTNDCITPLDKNQRPMYESLTNHEKYMIGIKGGSHCLMAESNFACSFGEATCKPKPAITREQQHAIINRYLVPWLDKELKNKPEAWLKIEGNAASDTSVVFKKN